MGGREGGEGRGWEGGNRMEWERRGGEGGGEGRGGGAWEE